MFYLLFSLTALEAAEEAHAQYLQKIITEQSPTSGAVIIGQRIHGRSGTPTGRRSRQRRSSSEPPVPPEDPVTILSPPPISASQRFWNRVGSGRRSSTGTNRTERQESDS